MIKVGQSMHPNWVSGDLKRLDEELLQIKDAGADSCELVLPGLDVVIGGRIIYSRQDALLEVLRRHELEYTMHMPHGLNLLDADMLELHMEVFKAGIEFARAAGIKLLNYHAGKIKSENKALINKEIDLVKALAADAPDVLFCMENPPFNNTEELSAALSAEEMIAFYEQVGLENFKLTIDIGHSALNHYGDMGAMFDDLNRLLPYAGHIHLHDNCGIRKDLKGPGFSNDLACGVGDIHLPLGWGRIPVEDVLAGLRGYNGIINLEIERRFSYKYSESFSLIREKLSL